MINRSMVRGLAAACVLFTPATAGAAEDSADALIIQIIADAKTNAQRASKLLEAATVMADQPKLCTIVLEKALEFALKPPASPAASQVAVQAVDLLSQTVPDRKDDWTLKRANALRLRYRCVRGTTEKKKAAGELLNGLLAAASVHEKRDDWAPAVAKYREAGPIAVYLKTGDTETIRAKLKMTSGRAKKFIAPKSPTKKPPTKK